MESPSHAASRAFGSIASNRGRIDALDEAAEVYFGTYENADDDIAEYRKLIKLASKASARRNEIAHGITEKYAEFGHEGGGWYLVPSQYNSRKNHVFILLDPAQNNPHTFTAAKYELTADQINILANGFPTVSQNIFNFGRRLRNARLVKDQESG